MRRTQPYQTNIPGHLLRNFLTLRENADFKNQVGPFSPKINFGMLTLLDFPKQKLLQDPYEGGLDEVTRAAIEKINKNTYGLLSKRAYSPLYLENSYKGEHYASLLYMIKTSKDANSFIAVLGKDIWSTAKERVITEIEGYISIFENELVRRLKEFYRGLVFKDLDLNAVVLIDEKEAVKINAIITYHHTKFKLEKHISDLFNECLREIKPIQVSETEDKKTDEVIIKQKKSDAEPLKPLRLKDPEITPFGIATKIRQLSEKHLATKLEEYFGQLDPASHTARPEAKELFLVLRKFLPLFWQRIKSLAEESLKGRNPSEVDAKGGLREKLFKKLEQYLYSSFWDFYLDELCDSKISVDKLLGLHSDVDIFRPMVGAIVNKAKDQIFQELNENERQSLKKLQFKCRNEILYDRWQALIHVKDYYGNALFWANLKGRRDITNNMFHCLAAVCDNPDKLFKAAIICNQTVDCLEKLFNLITVTNAEYMHYMDLAIRCGNTTAVKFLHSTLKKNINDLLKTGSVNSQTALQIACATGYLDMVQCLHLDCKADLMHVDERNKRSALYFAVKSNRLRTVNYLIKNIKKDTPQEKEKFIQFFANKEILDLLAQKKDRSMLGLFKKTMIQVDPQGTWEEYFSKLELLTQNQIGVSGGRYNPNADEEPEIDFTSGQGEQRLEEALIYGNKLRIEQILEATDPKMVSELLSKTYQSGEQKQDQNSQIKKGKGVLHLLLAENEEQFEQMLTWDRYTAVKYILEKSPVPLLIQDHKGRTPLWCVLNRFSLCNMHEIEFAARAKVLVKLLIKKGALVETCDDAKKSPMNIVDENIEDIEDSISQLSRRASKAESASIQDQLKNYRTQLKHWKELRDLLQTKPEKISLTEVEEESSFGVNPNEGIEYLNSLDGYIETCKTSYTQYPPDSCSFTARKAPTIDSSGPQPSSESIKETKATVAEQNPKPAEASVPVILTAAAAGFRRQNPTFARTPIPVLGHGPAQAAKVTAEVTETPKPSPTLQPQENPVNAPSPSPQPQYPQQVRIQPPSLVHEAKPLVMEQTPKPELSTSPHTLMPPPTASVPASEANPAQAPLPSSQPKAESSRYKKRS